MSGEVRRVSEQLLGRIVAGKYPAGLRLPSEVDLGRELACGRSTVREALRHLTGLGIVESRRGSGALVRDFRREGTPALLPAYVFAGRFDQPIPTLAKELLRTRSLLAGEAARLAALYAPAAALAEPRAILDSAPALEGNPLAHAENDLRFFRALVSSSGIWPAVWLANVFWAPMHELNVHMVPLLGRVPPRYQVSMTKLLDLIERREADEATRHLHAWFERVDSELLSDVERLLAASEQFVARKAP